jgi:hypothetical protein
MKSYNEEETLRLLDQNGANLERFLIANDREAFAAALRKVAYDCQLHLTPGMACMLAEMIQPMDAGKIGCPVDRDRLRQHMRLRHEYAGLVAELQEAPEVFAEVYAKELPEGAKKWNLTAIKAMLAARHCISTKKLEAALFG